MYLQIKYNFIRLGDANSSKHTFLIFKSLNKNFFPKFFLKRLFLFLERKSITVKSYCILFSCVYVFSWFKQGFFQVFWDLKTEKPAVLGQTKDLSSDTCPPKDVRNHFSREYHKSRMTRWNFTLNTIPVSTSNWLRDFPRFHNCKLYLIDFSLVNL